MTLANRGVGRHKGTGGNKPMGTRLGSAAMAIAGALALSACAGQHPTTIATADTSATTPQLQSKPPQVASLYTGLPKPAEPEPIELSDADFNCMVEAIYFEAGAEDPVGQRAVAHVILHRVKSPRFPDSVCAVVHDANERGCQFSYWCDGKSDAMSSDERWAKAKQAADEVLSGAYPDVTKGALFYHAYFVRPRWSKKMMRTAVIGGHIFYR
jgi:spore germination cell wall hydrolase CwlJ-like protein